jgi:hypothetical protein
MATRLSRTVWPDAVAAQWFYPRCRIFQHFAIACCAASGTPLRVFDFLQKSLALTVEKAVIQLIFCYSVCPARLSSRTGISTTSIKVSWEFGLN